MGQGYGNWESTSANVEIESVKQVAIKQEIRARVQGERKKQKSGRTTSMTDKLENERNLRQSDFRSQQIIMIVLQLSIRKMIPSTCITVQQRWRLDSLSPILASLAFKRIVGLAKGILVELEELSESVQREVPFCVFFLVDDC